MEEDQKAETQGKLVVGYNGTDNRISPAETGSTRKQHQYNQLKDERDITCGTNSTEQKRFQGLVGKPEGNGPL